MKLIYKDHLSPRSAPSIDYYFVCHFDFSQFFMFSMLPDDRESHRISFTIAHRRRSRDLFFVACALFVALLAPKPHLTSTYRTPHTTSINFVLKINAEA